MTNPDELERLARAALDATALYDARPLGQAFAAAQWRASACDAFEAATNPATILDLLAANRKMREAASLVLETNDRIVDAMLAAKDERTAASISLKGSDEFTATLAVLRSALTTQRGDGE